MALTTFTQMLRGALQYRLALDSHLLQLAWVNAYIYSPHHSKVEARLLSQLLLFSFQELYHEVDASSIFCYDLNRKDVDYGQRKYQAQMEPLTNLGHH